MMRSLFSGVSGLKNHQTRMDVIGNNISNVNTTGFKSGRVNFVDTLNQTISAATGGTDNLGGTNPKQIGLGSSVSSIDTLFTDGSVQSTGKNTDLCLSGNALFVIKEGNQTYYTRNGAFEFDGDGNYVLPGSGFKVQGWNGTDGALDTSTAVTDINVQVGKSMAASATVMANYANNLNAAALTIASMDGGTAEGTLTASAADKVTLTINGVEYLATSGTFSTKETYTVSAAYTASATSMKVKDSDGNEQTITVDANTTAVAADTAVTSVTGGTSTDFTKTKASASNTVIINDGTNDYEITSGTFYSERTYTFSKAVASGDTTITLEDSEGNTQTVALKTPATSTTAASTAATYTGGTTVTPKTASITNPITMTMSDGTKISQTSGTFCEGESLPITTTLTIYDTLGNVHSLPVYFTKTAIDSTSGNSWTVSLATNGSGTVTLSEADGTTTTVTMSDTTVDFTTMGKYDTDATRNLGGRTSVLTLTNGSRGTQTVTLDFASLTQFAGNNTVNGTTDGYAAGTLESISIDTTGTIYGTYTNGVRQAEAQVAVAQFTNAAGLTKTGSSLYQASSNSGTPNVKTTTDLGVKITPSALELSNVDIANEFADMIITQRGFQSNSKMITVGDEMLETVINMKR
ncbi:flagellar hook-basal body complex protein [Selenomonas sp. AB3002]|uniref:flagellar hook protein FlgE n=1 Tax=Selenomonas sp. AB3002 TaxID=1392502 RepID=UPI0004986AF5